MTNATIDGVTTGVRWTKKYIIACVVGDILLHHAGSKRGLKPNRKNVNRTYIEQRKAGSIPNGTCPRQSPRGLGAVSFQDKFVILTIMDQASRLSSNYTAITTFRLHSMSMHTHHEYLLNEVVPTWTGTCRR